MLNILYASPFPNLTFVYYRCEVQFDYGLRQKRFIKLEDRPTSFVSKAGKVIVAEKEVALRNDHRLQTGKVSTLRGVIV
jgi:hypothetical protein